MGCSFTLKCDICAYTVMTEGCPSASFRGLLNTFVCQHCKSLNDLYVGFESTPFEDSMNEQYVTIYGEERQDHGCKILQKGQRCNKCRRRKFTWWDYRLAACPHCPGHMQLVADGPAVCWD